MQVNLEEIEVMNLTAKSIIVYRCSEPNMMQIQKIKEHLRMIFPNNTVLIMDKTSELSIIEEEKFTHLGLCCEIEMPKND